MKTRILLSFLTAGFILESAALYQLNQRKPVQPVQVYNITIAATQDDTQDDEESFEVVAPEAQVTLL